MTKIFIIAAEASGDNLGSKIIKQLKEQNPKAQIKIIGGVNMQKQGLKSLFNIQILSVMGFFEVLPKLFKIIKLINLATREVIKFAPDILLTIDSPDFNFRVAKKVKKADLVGKIKKIHLIAPSVWAYREKRAEKIAKIYDQLLCILPFEPPYFTKYGLKSDFIGHPILENYLNLPKKTENFQVIHQIKSNQKIILITPGSRIGEIGRILPIFTEAFNIAQTKHKNLIPVILTTNNTEKLIKDQIENFAIKPILVNGNNEQEKVQIMQAANFAIAKSGTNAVELSFFDIPLVTAYKVNPLSAFIFRAMSNLKYVNLINILANKEIIPELIQEKCQPNQIAKQLNCLITDPKKSKLQTNLSQQMLKTMLPGNQEAPSLVAANLIQR